LQQLEQQGLSGEEYQKRYKLILHYRHAQMQ
jgi:hypothetical protein